jgi:dolichol-phosphate mannosyltransferase
MPDEIRLSVVLPSFLEEENLRVLLPRLRETLSHFRDNCEIVVIDTHAPLDNTRQVCEQHGARYVNRKNGDAFGNAVRTGIREARGEYILFMDADGSHPPEFIPSLYRDAENYDLVIASRYIEGGFTENNKLLISLSRILNITYSLVLGLDCKDVSNSFRIYRARLLTGIMLYSDNFDIIEEVLYKMKRANKGLRIKEVPFSFKKRMFGKTKRNLVAFVFSYAYTILKLRFGK